ncbi:Na+/H+ antiporter subunit G [Sulfitobacter sabulilitoris]|uniref:Na+/H+ antiporter subunit G n=1 Tax=Sulfitobacter sabulilitoris TaxID=2562655 RepID=A0A5S3PLZ9_9RHOB|nr:Na+/H+ antiporter subunit G [Sulfitobacter sabulilitoris]TMM55429.1 Na+/H+ antiporter subunit G [Sulfitobacter sabulilitoris]
MLADILISACLLIGGFFTLVGSYGLIKLRGSMSRLHAPTKSSTLGVGSLLSASMIHSFAYGEGSLHELLIMAFLFATAPIAGNFIAKVHLHRQRGKPDLPPPPDDYAWSTYVKK